MCESIPVEKLAPIRKSGETMKEMFASIAEPKVALNAALHAQLLRRKKFRASTYKSALEALKEIRESRPEIRKLN